MHYPYEAFLKGTGLTVKPFRIQWYTTAFNRAAVKWASTYPKLFTCSFDIGVFVTLALLPILLFYHLTSLYQQVTADRLTNGESGGRTTNQHDGVQLQLMLPGINLPLDEIGYYIAALGICSVVHEIGHAFAAVLEDVPVTGFGFHILLALPVAYTELGSEQMSTLRTWRKLRVLCAGVWHNVVLAAICFIIFSMLPILFTPFYTTNQSVIVTGIKRDSLVTGERGLAINDVITSINDCPVLNVDRWYECLISSIRNQPAYCIPSEYVLNHDESVPVFHTNEGVTECCDQRNPRNMCFEYITSSESGSHLIELPQFMCLNVRKTIEHSLNYCHRNEKLCQNNCIKPMMNNMTTVLQIKRIGRPDVMYIGHPSDVALSIRISQYVPKTFIFRAGFADGISLLLKYMVVFSLGLGIVNAIPCFCFDGYHITNTVTNHVLQRAIPERNKREMIGITLTTIGTSVFVVALCRSLWHSFVQYVY